MEGRKYAFSWDLLGDTETGRPNLGDRINIKVYRLMQYTFRDVLEREFGTGEADRLFLEAGKLAGAHFFRQNLSDVRHFHEFIASLQSMLSGLGAGIVRVEKADPPFDEIILTVAEDADCSGLPELEYEICRYCEGFIQGVLEGFTGRKYLVREIDCWCTGDRVCRFHAKALEDWGHKKDERRSEVRNRDTAPAEPSERFQPGECAGAAGIGSPVPAAG